MMRFLSLLMVFMGIFAIGGCSGENLVLAKGQVMKDGEPLVPDDEQALSVGFIPISDDGKPASNWYAAEVNQANGSFRTAGALKKGIPPGKYRVAVILYQGKSRKDAFEDKFNGSTSPFIVEIYNASTPIVLDIDNPQDMTK